MKIAGVCLFALFILTTSGWGQSQEPRVLASTDKWTITTDDFNTILDSLPPDTRATYLSSPENRRGFLEDLIQIWVMAEDGREKGIANKPNIQAMLKFYGNNVVARENRDQLTSTVIVSSESVEAYYKANPDIFTRVRVSHILILNSEAEIVKERHLAGGLPPEEARKKIEEVKAKMEAGEKFENLARAYSQDPGSSENGGDIGYVAKGQLTAAVEKAAYALPTGEYSDIIESPFGFHILHVTERLVTPFQDVQTDIVRQIMTDEVNRAVADKVDASGVVIDEDYFK